jgi:hypothetical protein
LYCRENRNGSDKIIILIKIFINLDAERYDMTEKFYYGLVSVLILILCIFLAGCSSSTSTTSTIAKITTQPVSKYSAGDIVTNNASTPEWMIISYDPNSDLYTRVEVQKNPDGTWNQVTGDQDNFPRADMEKIYPVLLTQVSVSSVPVATVTIPTTVTTTLTGSGPLVSAVSPTSGSMDSSVSVTLTGTNFQNGATLQLVQAGFQPIAATGVSVTSTQITGTFNINNVNAGPANVEVVNPDGRSSMTSFTIGFPTPVISSINPTSGAQGQSYTLTVHGQTLTDAQLVTLVSADGTSQVSCTNPEPSATAVSCTLVIPDSAPFGVYNINVITSDGTEGSATAAFTINNSTA